jgi:hypothetical protein
LTEKDIKYLPSSVQKYIVYSGAIAKEKVHNFKAVFRGKIRPKPDSDFLSFRAIQFNFNDKPTSLFFIRSQMFGLPLVALHLYIGSDASTQVNIASLF